MSFSLLSHLWDTLNPTLRNVSSHACYTLTSEFFLCSFSLGYQYSFDFSSFSIIFCSDFPSLRSVNVVHRLENLLRRGNVPNLRTLNSKPGSFHLRSNFIYDSICNMWLALKELIKSKAWRRLSYNIVCVWDHLLNRFWELEKGFFWVLRKHFVLNCDVQLRKDFVRCPHNNIAMIFTEAIADNVHFLNEWNVKI